MFKFDDSCLKSYGVIKMDLTKREKIGLTIFVIIMLLLVSIIYFNKNGNGNSAVEVISKNVEEKADTSSNSVIPSNTATTTSSKSEADIKVYISGEIVKPGVYTLSPGDRAERLVELAGGYTKNADTTALNLAMKLKDEDDFKIPNKLQGSTLVPTTTVSPLSGTSSSTPNKTAIIDINSATKEQLMDLPRIGEALSQRILDYREKMGAFKDIKDITNVSGIGEKMFENIKDKISVH